MHSSFLLFDDARASAKARLYRDPVGEIVANRMEEVRPALETMRKASRSGRHLAGFLAFEAGYALEPKLAPIARQGDGPLLWFGLFDGFDLLDQWELENFLGDPAGAWAGSPRPRVRPADYLAAAARVREHLFAGDFYQANLTFGCDVAVQGLPTALYAKLRSVGRGGWSGIIRHPRGWVLSASPEQFFTIHGGLIEAKPMKGTAARLADARRDELQVEHLAQDPKQRAENLMIVDLLRNDLARVAEAGTVEVPDLFSVETYPTVHQMVSRITASLREGMDAVTVLETLFPCGSVTGAPKLAAIAALAALEPEPRGVYTGSMGWIEPGGDASFNVLIRTLEIADSTGAARLGLGSGLVVDSVLDEEWDECILKGKFVAPDGPDFDLVETMRFDPESGIAELDRHLDRLRASAEALEFSFDRHAARNELQAATFRRKDAAVVRLLLSPKGTMAIELKPLPEPATGPVPVVVRPLPVDPCDFRLRFKTTARRFLDAARQQGGAFEAVFTDDEGRVTEGSFTNVFLERGGRLLTPPAGRALLAGLLRQRLIEEGRAEEADLTVEDLKDGFLIGNMVRGLIPARLVT